MASISHEPVEPTRGAARFQRAFLLLLVAGISVVFILVIRDFALSILLAAIFAGMSSGLYGWLLARLRQRRAPAALLTILILVLGVGLPLAGFLTLVAAEAVQISQSAQTWFQGQGDRLDQIRELLARIPFVGRLIPSGEALAQQFQEGVQRVGPALMGRVAAATRGTLNFLLQLFVLLYAMFFFLIDGREILRRILYYVPLAPAEEEQVVERFTSVTRATLKGSLLIGIIQGALGGLAFWVAGVPGAAFWGTVMVVLCLLPAVGAALVWIPAVVYLYLAGRFVAATALLAWCVLVVSTIDNVLRPRLVGKDARMSDLLILVSTLGGITAFGALGFIVGPIVAALFVTIWHIYGETFRNWLPAVPVEPTSPVVKSPGRVPEEKVPAP